MKSYLHHISILLLVSVFSCTTPNESSLAGIQQEVTVVNDLEAGISRVDLAISGMTCEVMCGTAIKKALADLDGVNDINMNFDAERPLDHAVVTVDDSKISETDLVSAIHGLYDGAYQVKSIKTEKSSTSESVESVDSKGGNAKGINTEIPDLRMPGLMDILSRILRLT